MKKFDTVVFDFDGTIMNTNEVILRSWQHTFQTIEHRDEDVAKIIKTFGEPLEVTMKKFFPDVPVDEAVEIYRSYHRDNFGDLITVFPGMTNLLRQVKERGEKTGLVTSRLAYTTKQGLEKYDLKDYFDVVVTAVLVGLLLAFKSGDDFGEDAPDHVIRKAGELLELL